MSDGTGRTDGNDQHDDTDTDAEQASGSVTGRVKVAVAGVVAALVIGVGSYELGSGGQNVAGPTTSDPGRKVSLALPTPSVVIPSKSSLLAPPKGSKYFGVSAPHAPWRSSALSATSTAAGGVTPNMVQYFINWTKGFDPGAVRAAYGQNALPVITWEPFEGRAKGTEQPAYSLATIIDGKHDTYIRTFAKAVKENGWPVALRFGHEMNGHWYPWAERNGVNKPGEFKAAWKHVHDIFRQVGADNVIWVWAPNTLRGADPVSLKSLYPGDAYVDWVGMSAYDVTEWTAKDLIDPTLADIRTFTERPLLITETGSQPGAQKAAWTASLFPWLKSHPDVIGFVWFQYTRAQGGGADWTFSSTTATRDAFRKGVKTLELTKVPGGH
ncbi:glycoside hydrolase family 26 protein [Streptomyces sp. NBC_00576]|uniref:glycoside hydrolase family 26 protein n=1 Tax=Streptomyces sp. NBC_00576 TaxID=2903665 RepID=UPI002E818D0E|nr:glycosyl hydrolase [Streptomyces sp. NBC_00576]WUB73211.1 glycosyl hydrolase [Streptomyces sp. NBC_00576]